MEDNKKAAPERAAAQSSEQHESIGNSTAAQRSRILAALRVGPLTTVAARRDLDCLHPAARVMELRNQGYLITTVWQWDYTQGGKRHRVARYSLLSKPAEEAV